MSGSLGCRVLGMTIAQLESVIVEGGPTCQGFIKNEAKGCCVSSQAI